MGTSNTRGGSDTPEGAVRGRARVTVVVPTFNRAAWLGGAIESVLAQTYADFELVVSDTDAGSRRDTAFSTTLDEDDLAGLPDDPDEFEEALRQMAGGDAVFQVNGFRGGRLPCQRSDDRPTSGASS